MNVSKYYLDSGNDWNKDRHCDLDGWFVDKDGKHKPIIKEINSTKEYDVAKPRYCESELWRKFSVKGNVGGIVLEPFRQYSLNDETESLSSPNLNYYLRTRGKGNYSVEKRIRELDKLINCFTVSTDINVFRGIPIKYNDYNKQFAKEFFMIREGDLYWDEGFLSTSYSNRTAVGYGLNDLSNTLVFLDITLKRGTHAAPLFYSKKWSNNEIDYEILVKREQKFKVTKKASCIIKGSEKSIIYIKMETI